MLLPGTLNSAVVAQVATVDCGASPLYDESVHHTVNFPSSAARGQYFSHPKNMRKIVT